MSSENRRTGRGRPATESAGRRDNEGGRRGRFVCARRLLSPVFRLLRSEPRPQRLDPVGVGGGGLAQVVAAMGAAGGAALGQAGGPVLLPP